MTKALRQNAWVAFVSSATSSAFLVTFWFNEEDPIKELNVDAAIPQLAFFWVLFTAVLFCTNIVANTIAVELSELLKQRLPSLVAMIFASLVMGGFLWSLFTSDLMKLFLYGMSDVATPILLAIWAALCWLVFS